MKNYGIRNFKYANVENFTSNTGIKLRRAINPALRPILKLATDGKICLTKKLSLEENKENKEEKYYPDLEKGKPYIFVSTHNFVEDSIANLATIDRNVYLLFGTSDQLEVNKDMYFAWLNGFVYVDREDEKNRKEALQKLERLLNAGTSVLIFPEGGFNNTENLLCQKLFSSPYILAKKTNCQVVPIAPYNEFGKKEIYMKFADPIDLKQFPSKEEANLYLRDILSTLLYENLLENAPHIKRSSLGKDPKMDYMIERAKEYQKTKWTKDVFDEELTRYLDKDDKELISLKESIDKIEITEKNAHILGPTLVRIKEEEKYNFNKFMHNNWNKKL